MRGRLAALLVLAAFRGRAVAAAQVAFDGSIGKAKLSQLTHSPFLVREEDGLLRGANSFLSFSQFTLLKGEEITFLGPSQVRNVIARVTNGQASSIDGTIHSPASGVNLFLINPAGIVFGQDAQLDVFGAFAATTADYIRFADKTKFSATVPLSPSLSSASPEAFGFLATRKPAAIHVGQTSAAAPKLEVQNGQLLSLVGGPIDVSHGQLIANGGRVNLISAAGPGEVILDATDRNSKIDLSNLPERGAITLDGGAIAQADLGGSVVIRGGSLAMNNAFVNIDTNDVRGGEVDIAIDGAADFTTSGIDLSTMGAAEAGSLKLSAGSVAFHGNNRTALGDQLTQAVTADSSSSGNGGNVDIESRGDITIDQHASISSSADASGNGGNITLHSGHVLTIDGNGAGNPLTGLVAETISPFDGAGPAGQIRIVSPRFDLYNEGHITSKTKGPGTAGLIRLDIRQLLIDGGHTHSAAFTGIEARVGDTDGGAQGNGGKIVIDSNDITLVRGGVITASTFGQGNAGGMIVRTGSLLIEGSAKHDFTGFFARTTLPQGAGNGGGINLTADSLHIDGPGEISASSDMSSGNAGGVLVQVSGPIELSNSALITVRSDLSDAGNLIVHAGSDITLDHAGIDASAAEDGGDIDVTAGKSLSLLRDSTVSGKAGTDGGRVTLSAPAVADGNSTVNGLAGAKSRPVHVRIALSGDLFISNATFLGADIITPPPYNLGGQLVNLVSNLAAPSARVIELCGHQIESDFSSFIVVGGNGLPTTPEAPQPAVAP
jgi:filamentous hemagglutinin family protein